VRTLSSPLMCRGSAIASSTASDAPRLCPTVTSASVLYVSITVCTAADTFGNVLRARREMRIKTAARCADARVVLQKEAAVQQQPRRGEVQTREDVVGRRDQDEVGVCQDRQAAHLC
jgi:hypothetical protein